MRRMTHWLDRQRVLLYSGIVLTLLVVSAIAWIHLSNNGVDPTGKPLGYDFVTLWAAFYIELARRAQEVYNIQSLFNAERIAVPASQSVGTSMRDSLREHSENLRLKRRLRDEEAAGKIAVKLLFPLIFCIFPTLMLVLLGPGGIQLLRVLLPTLSGQGNAGKPLF